MSFASIHFIFLFFPIVLLLFYISRNRNWRNTILVLASIVFFAWSDLSHLPLLAVLVLFNYFYGLMIAKSNQKGLTTRSKLHMWTAVTINILLLCFYKYTGFFAESIQTITQFPLEWKAQVLPLGISYLTFSALAYILDVYNGVEPAESNFIRFSAFLIMFPRLIQGPIARFGQVKDGLLNTGFVSADVIQGVRRFIIGLAKKVILADSLAVAANKVFNADLSTIGAGVAWFGLISFTLQIYFDFSGYTDMAVGLGRIFGFKLPENFNYPYISLSITDFWRRWHLSLVSWFRTYLFFPLEFARRKEKFLRQQSNLLIVFLLTGLWHGAGWNYVLWGVYFGLVLALEASGLGKLLKKAPRFLQHLYSISLIMLGWIFFRITDIHDWGPFLGALFGAHGSANLLTLRSLNILFYLPVLLLAAIFAVPVFKKIEERFDRYPGYVRAIADLILLAVFILAIGYILSNGFTPFMYAQF